MIKEKPVKTYQSFPLLATTPLILFSKLSCKEYLNFVSKENAILLNNLDLYPIPKGIAKELLVAELLAPVAKL